MNNIKNSYVGGNVFFSKYHFLIERKSLEYVFFLNFNLPNNESNDAAKHLLFVFQIVSPPVLTAVTHKEINERINCLVM